jgi:hypothetical protein
MKLPRRTFLHLAAGTAPVGLPARAVRIIVGAPSAPDHEKICGVSPSLPPRHLWHCHRPPWLSQSINISRTFSSGQRAFAMLLVQALVTVAGNQSAQTICGKAACRD